MDRIEWKQGTVRLGDLVPWEENPKTIKPAAAKRLRESRDIFGQVDTLAIGPNNELYSGHQRRREWMDVYGPNFMVDVRISSRPLTRQELKKLTMFLNETTRGSWDWTELINVYELEELVSYGMFEALPEDDLDLTDDEGEEEPEGEGPEDLPPAAGVPDAIWPASNNYGIPDLLLSHQVDALDLPVETWGAKKRGTRAGTIHFYTEDYRFERIWSRPDHLLQTKCINVVEPNFSVYDQVPRAVAIWQTYRKRWLARYWQSRGVRIIVDLNVARPFDDVNLLGVPEGWAAYATRGYSDNLAALDQEYKIARYHASAIDNKLVDILFMVYGGGQAVRDWTKVHPGAIWIAEDMDRAKGRYLDEVGG